MRADELKSNHSPAPRGLGRKRRDHGAAAARRRATLLCLLLGLGIWIAGQPEFFWGILDHGRPGIRENIPTLPPDLLIRTAEAADSKGRHAEAARLYGLFLTQHPEHPRAENALTRRLQTLVKMGDLEEAQGALRALQERNPASDPVAAALLEIAHARLLQRQLHQASRIYTEVVALMTRHEPQAGLHEGPTPASAAARIARHRERTRAEEKRTQMERVARFNLAVCQDLNHNRMAALRSYERFVRRFPADLRAFEAHFRMGILARELQRLDLAVQSFSAVWQDAAATPEFRAASIFQGGLCLERLHRGNEAIEVYSRVTQVTPPGDPYRLATLQRLAALLRHDDPLRAMQYYRELADHAVHAVDRALARQNLLYLQAGTVVATVH